MSAFSGSFECYVICIEHLEKNVVCFPRVDPWLIHFYPPPVGILVVPGFCPASRFLVGAKTTGQIFLKF